MPAPTSGLARVTIRAPRRRLDLAIPHQVPLAELLPEVLLRAGEGAGGGGWLLRRADGASLAGDTALAHQGVRDGDVLYLVPGQLAWPEPAYDDVVEEIAAGARRHGRTWDAAATRLFALAAAGLVLLTGLIGLATVAAGWAGVAAGGIAAVLLLVGALTSRALGDGMVGAAAAGFALPYAAAAGALVEPDAPSQVLVGGCGLLLASVLGAVAVGGRPRIFVAGVVTGLGASAGGLAAFVAGAAGAAAIVAVVAVGAIGLVPLLAVRLGRLPLPLVSAAPEVLATEVRPERPDVLAAVERADEILAGALLGIAVTVVGTVALLVSAAGLAGPLLAVLASAALLLRARLFPNVAARLPLLVGGLVGLAATTVGVIRLGSAAAALLASVAFAAVVVLLTTAATAQRARGSVYLARTADILDMTTVVALVPVACGVLDLYRWVSGLAG